MRTYISHCLSDWGGKREIILGLQHEAQGDRSMSASNILPSEHFGLSGAGPSLAIMPFFGLHLMQASYLLYDWLAWLHSANSQLSNDTKIASIGEVCARWWWLQVRENVVSHRRSQLCPVRGAWAVPTEADARAACTPRQYTQWDCYLPKFESNRCSGLAA
jgi:hypothetical protein